MSERLADEQVAWYAGTSRTAKWTADMAVHENIITLAREVQEGRKWMADMTMHIRTLHRLNGWSKSKGWWCSCGAPIMPRNWGRDTAEPRPWSSEGRVLAAAIHAEHVDRTLGAEAVQP